MFSLATLTEEQKAVAFTICDERCNAVVNAVAGSGKTRTALTTACYWLQRCADRNQHVLLVAYNKLLERDMTAQKNEHVPMRLRHRIEVRTIHGFGYRYFGGTGLTKDEHLLDWARHRAIPKVRLPPYGLVVLDEAQDVTRTLYTFLHYCMSLMRARPQLLILGDPFQLLYAWRQADIKYLVDAFAYFGDVVCDAPFKELRLSVCFRITHEMAHWINEHLNPSNLHRCLQPSGWFEENRERIAAWWADGIHAAPNRAPAPGSVRYIERLSEQTTRYGKKKVKTETYEEIHDFLANFEVDETALLASSITKNEYSPVRMITSALSRVGNEDCAWHIDGGELGSDIDRSTSRDPQLDVRRNKRIASTIHQFKGRERDAIVLIGLDAFAEMKGRSDPLSVFNTFYVGATRARKMLLIVQWGEDPYATLRGDKELIVKKHDPDPTPVTKLLRHCAFDEYLCVESPRCLTSTVSYSVDAAPFQRGDYIVSGAHHGKQRFTLENVSAVLGIALEIRLQLLLDDGVLQVPQLAEFKDDEAPRIPASLVAFREHLEREAPRRRVYHWAEVMHIATAFLTLADLFFVRWRQTDRFDEWPVVRESVKLDDAVRNLVELLYEPFCNRNQGRTVSLTYENKLDALRALRREKRLVMKQVLTYQMYDHPAFEDQHGAIMGELDVTLFPRPLNEVENGAVQESDPVAIIVDIKATSTITEDHRLQLACYGSMFEEVPPGQKQAPRRSYRNEDSDSSSVQFVAEKRLMPSKVNKDRKDRDVKRCKMEDDFFGDLPKCKASPQNQDEKRVKQEIDLTKNLDMFSKQPPKGNGKCDEMMTVRRPELYLAYATLGKLVRIHQHVDSFEFIHRLGCRKMHVDFDQRILVGTMPDPKPPAEDATAENGIPEQTLVIDVDAL